MKRILTCSLSLFALAFAANSAWGATPATPEPEASIFQKLDACDVTWNTLGNDSADSMPLGNGDIALNLWTEQNGDVLFYLSKSDAWNENNEIVKVGRVRVTVTPSPFTGGSVVQTLHLQNGAVELSGGSGASAVTMRIWVDANHPVVRVEISSAQPVSAKVTLDPWRSEQKGIVSADVVLPPEQNQIVWYHHNGKSRDKHLEGITFGAVIEGEGLVANDARSLVSKEPRPSVRFCVVPLTAVTPDVADWSGRVKDLAGKVSGLDWEQCWSQHVAWWRQFWLRSWIFVQGGPDAQKVTEGYQLQRFVTACAGRGAYPIKFNGSIFTMDNPAENLGKNKLTGVTTIEPETADFRAWGGQYWFQNTRPMYWPRLAAGDFDLMQPLFKMYREKLPDSINFVKQTYGHDGAYFAETAPFWAQLPIITKTSRGSYTFRYFTPILELTAMMLDYYDYTGDENFAKETLVPIAKQAMTFFSEHFPRDAQGKLYLDKDNSIEMYWDVANPLPDIAGLHYDLGRLLQLPPAVVDDTTRAEWTKLQAILPDVPMGMKNGKQVLLPYAGEQISPKHNSENPELYAVYPFRLYDLLQPNVDVALNTFDVRMNRATGCWCQDPIQAAMLGLTDLARKDVTVNLTNGDPKLKFPAFWKRGHDYMPDEDNGGNGEQALQKMLMLCDGKQILLLPAWPKDWSADFKLHAPYQTTVEGRVENGKIVNLVVTPESRYQDVKVHE